MQGTQAKEGPPRSVMSLEILGYRLNWTQCHIICLSPRDCKPRKVNYGRFCAIFEPFCANNEFKGELSELCFTY